MIRWISMKWFHVNDGIIARSWTCHLSYGWICFLLTFHEVNLLMLNLLTVIQYHVVHLSEKKENFNISQIPMSTSSSSSPPPPWSRRSLEGWTLAWRGALSSGGRVVFVLLCVHGSLLRSFCTTDWQWLNLSLMICIKCFLPD